MSEVSMDPRRIEVLDDDMARVLKTKSGSERLEIASSMFASARRMLASHLSSIHPDWSRDQILRETARRLSHGAV